MCYVNLRFNYLPTYLNKKVFSNRLVSVSRHFSWAGS